MNNKTYFSDINNIPFIICDLNLLSADLNEEGLNIFSKQESEKLIKLFRNLSIDFKEIEDLYQDSLIFDSWIFKELFRALCLQNLELLRLSQKILTEKYFINWPSNKKLNYEIQDYLTLNSLLDSAFLHAMLLNHWDFEKFGIFD